MENHRLSVSKVCALAVYVFLSAAECVFAQGMNVDEATARKLALEAVKPNNVDIELHTLPKDYSPGFYVFEIVSLNPNTSLVVSHVAVDEETGDVWDTAGECSALKSAALTQMQAKLKLLRQEAKRAARRPNCDAL